MLVQDFKVRYMLPNLGFSIFNIWYNLMHHNCRNEAKFPSIHYSFQSRKNNNNTIQAQRNDFHLLDCPCRYLYSFICFQIIIIVLPNTELLPKYELLAVVGCWREVFMQSNLSVCNHAASLQTFAFFIFIQSLTIMFHERRSRPQHVANYIQMILLVLFVWLRSEVVLTTSVNIASEPDWPGFESTRCLKLPELETLSFIIS